MDLPSPSAEITPKRRALDDPEGVPALTQRILAKLTYEVGRSRQTARDRDWFVATAMTVRDAVVDHWLESVQRAKESGAKRVYYLSLEFLIGRLLFDALGNLGLTEPVREALA
ncbi:MAG: glycogen phosphorylase, partial [Acetobacteraceae bacterium]|nr:glycogen phosphorylase [Acetobacteraceae bacterium]